MSYEKDTLQLNEIFVVPIGLKVVTKIDGQKLYGSEKLNNKFLLALSKSGRVADSLEKMRDLVRKKQIIPCFMGKSLFGFITRKVFSPKASKTIIAFYEPVKTKKIYVLLDNSVNFLTFTSNSLMATLTIHELMHMFADRKPGAFFNVFKSELVGYYKDVWKTIFSLDEKKIDNKRVEDIVWFLFKKFERSMGKITTKELLVYYKLLDLSFSPITTLDKKQFESQLKSYIVILKLFLTDFTTFYRVAKKFLHILNPLYMSYKTTFNIKNLNTLAVQELLYPSEIAAIISEHGFKAKVNKAIKQI